MTFDLAFGFGDEAEAGPVAQQGGEGADAERSGIPEWIEEAGPAAELLEPGFAPGEVVGLLARRMQQEFADFGVAREQRLGVVQGLGGDLAGMVDAHQRGGFPAVVGRQRGIGFQGVPRGYGGRWGRDRPTGGRGRQQGPQGAVGRRNQGIQDWAPSPWGDYRPGMRGS